MHLDEEKVLLIIAAVFLMLAVLEFLFGLYKSDKRFTRDWFIDVISLAQMSFVLKPLAVFLSFTAVSYLWPEGQGLLADTPFWIAFLIVFIPDDFTHYWYHRLAHEWDWMWPMHRTHHTAQQYQVTIAFRENWSWLFFMPGFWLSGLMIHMGLGEAVIISTLVIGLHNVVIHNGFTWDSKLYEMPVIGAFMRLFERVVNTPSLHRGHHGLGKNGVAYGNYAQTLFIWDQIFGTAVFLNEKLPERYGILSRDKTTWAQQLWWPFIKLDRVKHDYDAATIKEIEESTTYGNKPAIEVGKSSELTGGS